MQDPIQKSPVLEMDHVTLELGGETILEDVSLKIYHEDTLVIIGPSGGGKSVLLKTMAGVFTPTQGKVYCYGHEWEDLSMSEKHDVAKKIGVQFQKSALFDEWTAFENVAFPLREHTRDDEETIAKRVLECLKAVGLEAAKNLFPHEMSGGMRQRLGIARAIALKPDILFLDDPTAGLDPVNSDLMGEMILALKKEGHATLIIATHSMQMAYQFAGRILLVVDKKVIETGSAAETQNHPDPRVQQFIHGWLKGPLTEKY
ncbi:MAG: ATP-binding cassette domain-containing protein [Pseudobdellovibrionaceae bacterium]